MKYLYIILTLVFSISNLFAQNQLIFDDMESYTVGNRIVEESTEAYWVTWSGTEGSTDDAVIVDTEAYSGTQSVRIIINTDIVMLFDKKTTGRYQVEFYLFVNTGKGAYFNLLHDFDGADSEWGLQVFFNDNGTGVVHAGKSDAATFNYNQAEWLHVNTIVDLDDDFATLYIAGNELVSWKWSSGSFGIDSLNQLDALNLYGWVNDTTKVGSEFFVDDIKFSEQEIAQSPTNLSVDLDDENMILSWDTPSTTPDSYLLTRDGVILASGITETTYFDYTVYPGTHKYSVRAHYDGLGYSASSNEVSETLSGGTARDVVLFEININTSTMSEFGPGAARGADDLKENGHEVAIIEYHNGDEFATYDSQVREVYYNVTGFPTTTIDGIVRHSGGSANESLYPAYLTYFNDRDVVPSVLTLDVNITPVTDNSFEAVITIGEIYPYFESDLVLRTALTESNIRKFWRNRTKVNFVCRKMYPDANGTELDFSSTSSQTETISFNTMGYKKENCSFVVFVQYEPTKEIVQTVIVDLESIVDVAENIRENKISIYPNPASDYIQVFSEGSGRIDIYNLIGQIKATKNIENTTETINIKHLNQGMYFVKIITSDKVYTEKLIIK